jgi:hypothetical protein
MEKTVRDYLRQLPEPFRKQALDNISNERSVRPCEGIVHAINSFVWDATPEGHSYWNTLSTNYKLYGSSEMPSKGNSSKQASDH